MILKRRFVDGSYHYSDIGKQFSYVDKEAARKEWDRCLKEVYNETSETFNERVYAFIVYETGSQVMPLHKGSDYTLYNENGGFFKELTFC